MRLGMYSEPLSSMKGKAGISQEISLVTESRTNPRRVVVGSCAAEIHTNLLPGPSVPIFFALDDSFCSCINPPTTFDPFCLLIHPKASPTIMHSPKFLGWLLEWSGVNFYF